MFPLAQYVPFLRPLPIWDYWYLLLFPLCIGVAVVYKCIKTPDVRRIPWESLVISLWIILGMCGAALALAIVVRIFS
ncbi:MAG TPA: hypothetical protein VGN72_24410 [Tepidisphaeraceae bacterium]|jgi:hypothetical protein|nr:hypothetical protein [Tepidisphaeraceae bacterium]